METEKSVNLFFTMVSAHKWHAYHVQGAIETQTACPQEICHLDKETKERYSVK